MTHGDMAKARAELLRRWSWQDDLERMVDSAFGEERLPVDEEMELLGDIEELWPDIRAGHQVNDCILATRTAIEVARYFGYTWSAMPIDLVVFNEAGLTAFMADLPISEWPDEAWSLGNKCANELKRDGWDGHLVIAGPGWLADISTAQFDRPKKSIEVVPWALDVTQGSGPPWLVTQNDVKLWINPRPDITVYRQSRDWRMNYEPLAAAIIRELKDE